MSNVIVRSSSTGIAVNNGPSVLGERQAKIPVGGKIRPGIKVLTSTAAQHKDAKRIYDAGVAAGKKWAVIEAELIKLCKFEKSPLTPRNVDYFSVFRADFSNPATADQILAQYGTDVNGKRRLLRFPVIFPTDSWQANLPHALTAYKSNEKQFWSDYDQAGNRRCFTKGEVQKDERSKRATRTFGGRPTIPRPENDGLCKPELCPQYQSGACKLSGNLLFFIPGVPGASAISLPLTSFYGMDRAREAMEMVAFIRSGRISGTHNGKPIFWITKKLDKVSMLDRETGLPKKVDHWIVTIEADIDMGGLFQQAEQRALTAGADGAAAAAILSAPEAERIDDGDGAIEGELVDDEPSVSEAGFTNVQDGRKTIAAILTQIDVQADAFGSWMVRKHGDADWSKKVEGLRSAYLILQTAIGAGIDQWKQDNNLDAPF